MYENSLPVWSIPLHYRVCSVQGGAFWKITYEWNLTPFYMSGIAEKLINLKICFTTTVSSQWFPWIFVNIFPLVIRIGPASPVSFLLSIEKVYIVKGTQTRLPPIEKDFTNQYTRRVSRQLEAWEELTEGGGAQRSPSWTNITAICHFLQAYKQYIMILHINT